MIYLLVVLKLFEIARGNAVNTTVLLQHRSAAD